ncbi:MAG: hypothetical protein IEMM0002_0013 [bacterium]|nr:MAG: hypothetical protein IEMM0002_0013 [bacterium]
MKKTFTENFFIVFMAFLILAVFYSKVRRQSAQANLKTGIVLNEKNSLAAIEVLQNGIKKNPDHYLLYLNLAKSLQKKAFAELAEGKDAKMTLLEARRNLKRALALRFDGAAHQLLGYNYELEGKINSALAHYNISFFFSQNESGLERWEGLRERQSKAAEKFFRFNSTGIALIMVYNAVSGYKREPARTPAEVFIKKFFLSTPPDEWLSIEPEKGNRNLKKLFLTLKEGERKNLNRAFENAGFGFLARFLDSSA